MTGEQQFLVEQNFPVVRFVLWKLKLYNNSLSGLAYEDLYQEGCLALCYAALSYRDAKGASFQTFAEVVIQNHILNCFKKASQLYCKEKSVEEMAYETEYYYDESRLYVLECIAKIRENSTETTNRGLDVILLKMAGYKNRDIAEIYSVKSSIVYVWIKRGAERLKLDKNFLEISA